MSIVYVLGSGFSAAVSGYMPTTNALADALESEITDDGRFDAHLVDGRLPDRDVERWLSRLAERHPFDDDVTYKLNYALFTFVSRAIAKVIRHCEQTALAYAGPFDWFEDLVRHWHESRSTVVTFNYDTLVETTFNTLGDDKSPNGHVLLRPGGVRYWQKLWGEPGTEEGLALCKLHGSINWYWQPDGTDRSILDVGVEEQWSQYGRPDFPETELLARVGSREPFIVPPTSLKGGFYAHDTLRHHWGSAARALQEADEVVLIGYSLPLTDLVSGSLLGPVLQRTPCTIVSRSPEAVAERVQDFAQGNAQVTTVGGADAVEDWAQSHLAQSRENIVGP